jgi:hypothetical protein
MDIYLFHQMVFGIYIYINGYNCDITYSYAGFPGWGIFYQIVRIIKH